MKLKIKPFSEKVEQFYRHHSSYYPGDAGLDIFVVEEITFLPGETKSIGHQIACEAGDGKPYFLIPRSSIAKTPLRMSNSIGLIDGGYRGEIIAFCDNIGTSVYTVSPGQRLFQIVAIDGSSIEFEIVESLSESSRGRGGFGSTGF